MKIERERDIAHTTWSKPHWTKAKVGNQMPATLLKYSRPLNDRYAAKQTSQLAPTPRRKIWCQAGVMAFAVPKVMTRA
jgi:hypothetical protein